MATVDVIQTTDTNRQLHTLNRPAFTRQVKEQTDTVISSYLTQTQSHVAEKKKYAFNESDSVRQTRMRSLSHWTHLKPSGESMAKAGWFSCNVHDRVLCIYCNTICHGWRIDDDPMEVEKKKDSFSTRRRTLLTQKSSTEIS